MKKIVIDKDIPYLNGVIDPFATVDYIKGTDICRKEVADADALIIRTRTLCNRELLEGSSVELIVTATIGYDHIDMEYCKDAGIEVVVAAGCNARGVLQWVAGVLHCACETDGSEPSAHTLGVVGVGHVGSLVAQYARMWGFNVICCDPPRERAENGNFVSFDTIMRCADIITFHTPLTRTGIDATYHLAGKEFFEKIRCGSLIINSSRGEVVDNKALLSAIENRNCRCAIDTWENEPNINPKLLQKAIVATTHIAGYSAQGKANGSSIAARATAAKFGFPLENWYPRGVVCPTTPHAIDWRKMCSTIQSHFDYTAETARLKADVDSFESIRNSYDYRQEYF